MEKKAKERLDKRREDESKPCGMRVAATATKCEENARKRLAEREKKVKSKQKSP